MKTRSLELLSPAANADIAIQAVAHGADAVYIGASSHGARKAASNSVNDIRRVVEYAHKFRARVYVTVNTIVYDSELAEVERLCRELYRAGVDALIVQDMALLRLDLPPIELHASTQCDIRTPEKALFLQEVGFSQLVLARELTIPEIKAITDVVSVPVECFVHGALCVSYSGRCHASCALTGRSANRGECAQICRLPYTLTDANGRILSSDRHLLSLKDFNASAKLPDLVAAGVSSFKIEGRLKEVDYVKNITAHYNGLLNKIVDESGGSLRRSSFGHVDTSFSPNVAKSFNRGFTDYFLSDRKPLHIASLLTPKSMGETVTPSTELHNGDGISFFDKDGVYKGININTVKDGKIQFARKADIPRGATLHRTHDVEWQKIMGRPTASRRLAISVSIDPTGVTASDEIGSCVRIPLGCEVEKASRPMDYRDEFSKLGNTPFLLANYESKLPAESFIPKSVVTGLRRRLVDLLIAAGEATYPLRLRRLENKDARYPATSLDFRDNVANKLAERFYREHGVESIQPAMETGGTAGCRETVVMTTRHCVLRELGLCKKTSGRKIAEPLHIRSGDRSFRLDFKCSRCEMEVVKEK